MSSQQQPILVDGGRSSVDGIPRGWSTWGQGLLCEQLWIYPTLLGIDLWPAGPLTRGSMGHAMASQRNARFGCVQKHANGSRGFWHEGVAHKDPSAFYTPEAGVEEWVRREGRGAEFLDRMKETYKNWIKREPLPPGIIVGVEMLVVGVVGDKVAYDGKRATGAAQRGLWLIKPETARLAQRRDGRNVTIYNTPSGDIVYAPHVEQVFWDEATKQPILRCEPLLLSRRWDLVYQERTGHIIVDDYKFTATDPGRSSADYYAMDGQFAVTRLLAAQAWPGKFKGAGLHFIQTRAPWRVVQVPVPVTPWRDKTFAERLLAKVEHLTAEAKKIMAGTMHAFCGQGAQGEFCWGRYGPCRARELCMHGPAALEEMAASEHGGVDGSETGLADPENTGLHTLWI